MEEILIFISDEYADWEIGYIGYEIRKTNEYKISTVSINKEVIISMGGLNVNPTYYIDEVLNKNIEKQSVRTDSFITANGTVTLEFSREIMKSLEFKTEEEIDNWYKFNKNGFYSE